MPPKRKYTAAILEEEPSTQRQLRSSKPLTTAPSLPTKAIVASRRPKTYSSQKRAKRDKISDFEDESSEELDPTSIKSDKVVFPDSRHLSSKTKTIRVCPPGSFKANGGKALEMPKARRGRPKQTVDAASYIVGEISSIPVKSDTSIASTKPVTRSGQQAKNSDVEIEAPPAEVRRGRSRKQAAVPETIISDEGSDTQAERVKSEHVKSDKTTSKSRPNTNGTRRSTKITTFPEVVLPPSIHINVEPQDTSALVEIHPDNNDRRQRTPITQSPPPNDASCTKTLPCPEAIRVTEAGQDDTNEDMEQSISQLAIPSPGPTSVEFDHTTDLTAPLPDHLHSYFNAYKDAILKSINCPPIAPPRNDTPSVNDMALKQLSELIDGTVLRAEGNSCLLLGPRGSGKSQMIEACLEHVADTEPIILRLSGWVQSTDRHALREIAFQLLQQTGTALLPDTETDPVNVDVEAEEDNPFLEPANHTSGETVLTLPSSSHLHALIPVLLTLSRPVIVILDAFDLFTLHPRQSLLYCLLDTVQNCRASSENRGMAVIGVTSRVDTVQLLEKRVKSRFSGRTIRTAPPGSLEESLTIVTSILQPSNVCEGDKHIEQWKQRWTASVQKFLAEKSVVDIVNETFGLTREFKVILRIMTACVVQATPSQPYLSPKIMAASAETQRSRHDNMHFNNLSYPALCLLIASVHADTGGHKSFTFEMLYEKFRDQVRALASAPVQFNGASIGMMRCPREVLISSFEDLVSSRVFVCTIAAASSVAKQFIKYRCTVHRQDIKLIVEKSGNTNLKKWLNKLSE